MPETTYWVASITTTIGSRMRDYHIPEMRNGWEYSARKDLSNFYRWILSFVVPVRTRTYPAR
jgi:hypothetical protein